MRGGMRWVAVLAAVVFPTSCMPAGQQPDAGDAATEGPVRLSEAEVAEANDVAGCVPFEEQTGSLTARHVGEDAPPAAELYDERPPTAGDHLGAWVEARTYEEAPDERAVVHNHEHGAVSVWYDPSALDAGDLDALVGWAEQRNTGLANDAGAGVIVAPFPDGLPDGATVSFRAWSGGLDCASFDTTAADGFLLERFGQAPEGNLAPDLRGIVDRATAA